MDSNKGALESATSPVKQTDRVSSIDILRGLALFGVMAINLVTEFRVSIFERFLTGAETGSVLDSAVQRFLLQAFELKALALFSFLFGVGLAIQFDRLASQERTVLLLRRLAVLFAIGLVHLIFIWNGDILTEYALVGFIALPFLFGPRWLLGISGIIFLGLYLALPPLMPLPNADTLTNHAAEARAVYGHGNFFEVLAFRISELRLIGPLHVGIFPRTLALVLLGAFVWRTGLLQNRSKQSGLFFGIAFAGLLMAFAVGEHSRAQPVALAFCYGALITALVSTQLGAKGLAWAAPVGRMAFTNYLTQSVLFAWVFYGYGLGLFGQVGAAATLAFGVVVYVAQIFFSRWWLASHAFGPMEWLWRRLMYGTRVRLGHAGTPLPKAL